MAQASEAERPTDRSLCAWKYIFNACKLRAGQAVFFVFHSFESVFYLVDKFLNKWFSCVSVSFFGRFRRDLVATPGVVSSFDFKNYS